jgi:hypothetical protein
MEVVWPWERWLAEYGFARPLEARLHVMWATMPTSGVWWSYALGSGAHRTKEAKGSQNRNIGPLVEVAAHATEPPPAACVACRRATAAEWRILAVCLNALVQRRATGPLLRALEEQRHGCRPAF